MTCRKDVPLRVMQYKLPYQMLAEWWRQVLHEQGRFGSDME